MKNYNLTETAKEIKQVLKASFPGTKFSIRSKSYPGGSSIDVRWTDGPTGKQVGNILDRFESTSYDGMNEVTNYHGERKYKGQLVEFHSGYVHGSRSISPEVLMLVADRIAYETGTATPTLNQYGSLSGADELVPFSWHEHWLNSEYLTIDNIKNDDYILAHDSHQKAWRNQLINAITYSVSLEEARVVELPEYIKEENE